MTDIVNEYKEFRLEMNKRERVEKEKALKVLEKSSLTEPEKEYIKRWLWASMGLDFTAVCGVGFREVATILGKSKTTIETWNKKGKIKAVRTAYQWLVPIDEVIRLKEQWQKI